jgi:hypothetical protein
LISTKGTRIWTPYGYLFAEDLYIGEKVISFNPDRGVCEYDTIKSIDLEYKNCGGFGISSKSMRQVLTPDHPIIIWNDKTKELNYVPIEDRFMQVFSARRNNSILSHALFEPYKRTQDINDIEWSARVAATIAAHRRAKVNIKSIVKDLGGYEAQVWLDTFFHWNRLIPARNWMATVKLTNLEVRDIIFDIAPRAGVGVKWYFRGKNLVASMTTNGYVNPSPYNGWFKQKIDGLVFNLTTKNGNALARANGGTFLVACNRQEN